MTPTIDQLWALLQAARAYQVTVLSPDGALRHAGRGEITVEGDVARIIWRETGRWETGPLAGIRFHNSSTWSRDGESLTVQHLRRGDDQPTFLARLELVGETWRSVEPHLCGEDRYHAMVRIADAGVRVEWRVESPTDPYSLSILI